MALDPREFIRLHAGMPEHPKVDPLSDAAFRCLIEAWCLCRRSRNDGHIPIATWRKKWKARARKELVEAGLVVLETDAAVMRDWLEHQPSVAELDAKRSAKAEAGRKGGVKSGQARRARSESEADASGSASPESDHETVTFTKNLPELERESDVDKPVENRTVSDDVQTSLPADIPPEHEAGASDSLEQQLKQTMNQIEPELEIEKDMGYVGGFSYASSAHENAPPPPKHHPKHPDRWEPDCGDCTTLIDEQIDWQAAQFADVQPPAPYCDDHPGGTPDPCHACRDRRHDRNVFDVTFARLQATKRTAETRRAAETKRLAIANCTLCDAEGYAGTVLCDHDPDTPARAARHLAKIRANLAAQRASAAADPEPPPDPSSSVSVPTGRSESAPHDEPTTQENHIHA